MSIGINLGPDDGRISEEDWQTDINNAIRQGEQEVLQHVRTIVNNWGEWMKLSPADQKVELVRLLGMFK